MVAVLVPAERGVVLVVLAVGEGDDLLGGGGEAAGGGGEFAFVLEVDGDGLAEDGDGFGARGPGEVGIREESVVTGEGGEVVSVGIAVALGEHALGVGLVDGAIGGGAAGFFFDVIIGGVDGFAAVDAVGVIPEEAVVGGGGGDAGADAIVAAAEEGEFFVEGAGDLALEGEAAGVDGAGVEGNGGVSGVGVGLVAEEGVEVVEVAGGEDEGVVGVGVVGVGVDAHAFSAVEHGFVDFDEPGIVDGAHGEGEIAFPAGTGLGEHADVGIEFVVVEVFDALFEGIDGGEDAFDPPFVELWRHPAGPSGGAEYVVGAGLGLVAHGEPAVVENEGRTAEGIGGRAADEGHVVEFALWI